MDTLKILLAEFWWPFIGVLIGMLLVWLLRRRACDACLPLVNTRSFAELSAYSKDEQVRLLHEASKEAFRHLSSYTPVAVFVFFFAAGEAVAHTLPKVTTIPSSWWVIWPIVAVFAAFGGWLAGSLTIRLLRPLLRAGPVEPTNAILTRPSTEPPPGPGFPK